MQSFAQYSAETATDAPEYEYPFLTVRLPTVEHYWSQALKKHLRAVLQHSYDAKWVGNTYDQKYEDRYGLD